MFSRPNSIMKSRFSPDILTCTSFCEGWVYRFGSRCRRREPFFLLSCGLAIVSRLGSCAPLSSYTPSWRHWYNSHFYLVAVVQHCNLHAFGNLMALGFSLSHRL